MTAAVSIINTPEVLGIDRLLEAVPFVRSEPLVGLAHRNLEGASEGAVDALIIDIFEGSWDMGLSPSEALSLLCASTAGREAGFRKLTPAILWERFGAPSFEARQAIRSKRPTPLAPDPRPDWWGSRFEVWAGQAAPEVPVAFRRAVGWAVLSAVFGDHLTTPIGSAQLTVGLAGVNVRTRGDAGRLGGDLVLSIESSALANLTPSASRLWAIESDDVVSVDALRERQGPPAYGSDAGLAMLLAEALDGLEKAQAAVGGEVVVRASDGALEAVTALRQSLVIRLQTLSPDTVDELLTGSALLVRRMGALVAISQGEPVVSDVHQTIAIDAARESIDSHVRYLTTGRWLARQA